MANLRNAIQQYGAIVESLVHAFLSFAPVAAGPEDAETEQSIQLIQSISDLVALRRDKYLTTSGGRIHGIKFVLRILKCFQLWAEMRSSRPRQFALRLELVRLSISMLALNHSGERLPDTEFDSEAEAEDMYVGSRTGTRLRSLSKLFSAGSPSQTQFSDFLHAIVPLVYLSASKRGGWSKANWSSWLLAVSLETASIMSLPDGSKTEKKVRIRRMFVEALLRQPMFNVILARPGGAISRVWNMVPLLRDFNYLEYYLFMHKKYFYFHQ